MVRLSSNEIHFLNVSDMGVQTYVVQRRVYGIDD